MSLGGLLKGRMACPLGIPREVLVGMFRADLTEAVMGEVLTHGLTLHHLSVTNLIKIDFKLFPSCMFVYSTISVTS